MPILHSQALTKRKIFHIDFRLVLFSLVAWFLCFLCLTQDVSAAQPTKTELRSAGLLSVLDPEFGTACKADGSTDCTRTIQNTMDAAYERNLITYFPPGTYKITDTLVALKDRGARDKTNYQLIGSTEGGQIPTIILAPNSFNDNNAGNDNQFQNGTKKAMIHMWACLGTREAQDGPKGCDPKYATQLNDVNKTNGAYAVMYSGVLRNLKFEISSGNPDAIGVRITGNQRNEVSNVQIHANQAFAGFYGTVGTNSFVQDLTVIGGKYGVYNGYGAWGAYSNVTLKDQQILAFTSPAGPPSSLSGFEIVKRSAPAIGEVSGVGYQTDNTNQVGSFSLNDGTIEFESNNQQQAAILTPQDKQVSVVNVFIKNSSKLVQAGTTFYQGNENGWSKINTFANTMPTVGYSFVNGVTASGNDYVVNTTFQTSNIAAPNATRLKMNHGISKELIPSPDVLIQQSKNPSSGVVNVLNEGIVPIDRASLSDSDPDYSAEINALINREGVRTIFFPQGIYPLRSTITLKQNTQLIGVHPGISQLETHPLWRPQAITDVVKTVNSAEGEALVAYLNIRADRGINNNKFNNLHWMVGKKSVIYSVNRSGKNENVVGDCQTAPGWGTNNYWLWYTGNGGGRLWGAGAESSNCSRWSPYHRGIFVDGTSQPLIMYGLNPEDGHGSEVADRQVAEREGYMVEIKNAKNVSIRSHKSENAQSLLVRNSENIFIMNPGGSVDWALRNNSNITVVNMVPKFINWSGKLKPLVEIETNGEIVQSFRTNAVVSIIKNGDVNFDVWNLDYTPPISDPTPTQGSTPTQEPTPTSGDEPEDWDLDNDGDVDVHDFNQFVRRVMMGNEVWSNVHSFVSAFRTDN